MEDSVFCKANLVNEIVSHMAGITYPYPPQVLQDPSYEPTTILIPNAAPMIAPIVQPDPSANATPNASSTILPRLITIIQKMQQLMVQMQYIKDEEEVKIATATPVILPLISQQPSPENGNPTIHYQIFQ